MISEIATNSCIWTRNSTRVNKTIAVTKTTFQKWRQQISYFKARVLIALKTLHLQGVNLPEKSDFAMRTPSEVRIATQKPIAQFLME